MKIGTLTLNGNLNLATGSTNFAWMYCRGRDRSRNSSTGTVIFSKPANGYSGNLFQLGGDDEFYGAQHAGERHL